MYIFYAAAFATLAAFVAAGTFIGKKSSDSKDFSLGGRKSSVSGVAGILLGALVGGASTVGTVQMAYSYGMTAGWFTLGGGIACLFLGLRFASPLRSSGITTVADFLANSYGGESSFCGSAISSAATVSSSIGTFISICAQFLSCIAMLRGVFPLSAIGASVLASLSILGFITSGGMKSYSKLGEAKIILLYFVLISCFTAALLNGGGFVSVAATLPFHPWFNVFGRGFLPELGYFASMVAGVFTTQIYIQSFAAAKDAETARKGAFVSAILMPPMGLLGIWIGLSVRAKGIEIAPDQVLSWFITDSFPPVMAGLLWGGILITVVGCAAGLVLGIATNIQKNLIPKGIAAKLKGREAFVQRSLVIIIVLAAAVSGISNAGAMILELSFLSMGLRGAGTLFPFVLAVLKPDALTPKWALASSIGGLAGMLLWALLGLSGDPMFAGLGVSALCVAGGVISKRHRSV